MSDDEDYYDDDDDDYFYIDDGPVAEAVRVIHAASRSNFVLIFGPQDDLAEHTIHSPVLRDHDPSDDLTEYWSDWEYYSDDYYDEAPSRSNKDLLSNGGDSRQTGEKRKFIANNGGRRKRPKQDSAEDIIRINFADRTGYGDGGSRSNAPIVVWRSKEVAKNETVTHQGNGETVALLKDWREVFGTPSYSHDGDIGRNTKFKKRDADQSMEPQTGMDGSRFMATRVPRVTRPNARPPIRRNMPDGNSVSFPKDRTQAT